MVNLVRCKHCGKIYKTFNGLTDYGDILLKCFECGHNEFKTMQTEDWIADLMFKVKGN